MKKVLFAVMSLMILAACSNDNDYKFVNGYPTKATIQKAYDDADFARAVQAYKFFYPTVSGRAIIDGNLALGLVPNKVFGTLDTKPLQVGFTLNSDTPYAPVLVDLSKGPYVVELPAAPLIVVSMDVNQRWVADMGIPGPDGGKGGKHLLLPPGYKGSVPAGYYVWRSSSNNLTVGVRALPVGGDVDQAIANIKKIKFYPLDKPAENKNVSWPSLNGKPQDTTPISYENTIKYWEVLHSIIEAEPAYEGYMPYYGDLAALGIKKGSSFTPDARMKTILERAAKAANAQMRVQSFADRRADAQVWPDRKWQWVSLVTDNGNFETPSYLDNVAREVWFYQAIGASPAMFRRMAGQGSVYWLGMQDKNGQYVDGAKTYKLSIPQPVPAKLFWSVTVYDTDTRSQISTDQGYAALRSMFELKDLNNGQSVELYFGPKAPAGKEKQWIKTIPGKGWFAYIRIYGPEAAAFDGSWKPGDFELVK